MLERIVTASAVPARFLLAAMLVTVGRPNPRAAEEAAAGVIVCDDLVGLRRLMMQPDAGGHLAEHPGCRRVEAARIGAVERRAIVGGMPFECVALAGGACVWPLP